MAQWLYKFNSVRKWRGVSPETIYFSAPHVLRFAGVTVRDSPHSLHSQHAQDSILLTEFYDLISDAEFPKVFLDVGCNHPTRFSNSLFFERQLGFKTFAVDAIADFKSAWCAERPGATFVHSAVGEQNGTATFDQITDEGDGSMLSAVAGASAKLQGRRVISTEVPMKRMDDLLQELQISSLGIASIDVEGFESQVMNGWDMTRFPAVIVIIENNSDHELGSDELRRLMLSRGYSHHARIWKTDDIFVLSKALKARVPIPSFNG